MVRIGNQIVGDFLTALVTCGIILASVSGYAIVKLYYVFPFLLYLVISMIFHLCLVVDFFMVSVGSVINENGIRFLNYWKCKMLRREEKMQIRACPRIGYSFALIKNCTATAALSIADINLNTTATLVLM